ncbi:MAG TPA: 1,6-dihydroxycyclohexa-2,4-diene-1-carboxylate dehydrogenase [Nevskiaceae bacterium]|nr:1,6-dihydroxycyclohexa-2,4-diene-1-carboxylate dehydrogenase [Nevskiaceae bacterium]
MRFDGKVVIVTGAAQGIGRACARRFASEGARVIVADRAEEGAQAAVADIRATKGCAEAIAVDLSTHAGAGSLVEQSLALFGRIDVSVHNVGGAIRIKPFWRYTESEIEAEVRQSLWPTVWCCHAVLPTMIRQGSGVIVNIGSVATRGIHRLPYSAAKGAIHALTASLALETADLGIRVNCVAPGGTEVRDRVVPRNADALGPEELAWIDAVKRQTLRDTPQGRFGTVEEQAAAVAFLASDEASYVTGQTLFVAGGGIG